MLDIGIVIVTYNSASVIGGLLDSIPEALQGLAAKVVVVDNGSVDDTVNVLEKYHDCLVIRHMNNGYAAGLNRGIQELPSDCPVMVLNPDVLLGAGSLRVMLECLSLPRTGIVAPKVANPDGTLYRSLRRRPTLLRACGLGFTGIPVSSAHVTNREDYSSAHYCDWALGAALLISPECSSDTGEWDESFFLYSEETDYSLRARDKGWLTRFEPSANVVHIGGQSGRNARTHTMQIVNRVRLYRRRHGVVPSFAYYCLTILSETTWLVRGSSYSGAAILALIKPSHRPREINAESRMIPY